MKNERFKKHIALLVTTLIIVTCVPGTLVFASDSDSYEYSNHLLSLLSQQLRFTEYEHGLSYYIVNASYFVGDSQSSYYYSSGTANYISFSAPTTATRYRFTIDFSSVISYGNRILKFTFPSAVFSNVYDVRIYNDGLDRGMDVILWYWDSDNTFTVLASASSAGTLNQTCSVDLYCSEGANFYISTITQNLYYYNPASDFNENEVLMFIETLHAINNLSHLYSFQEAQIADVVNANNSSVISYLDNIYQRMTTLVYNHFSYSYNGWGVSSTRRNPSSFEYQFNANHYSESDTNGGYHYLKIQSSMHNRLAEACIRFDQVPVVRYPIASYMNIGVRDQDYGPTQLAENRIIDFYVNGNELHIIYDASFKGHDIDMDTLSMDNQFANYAYIFVATQNQCHIVSFINYQIPSNTDYYMEYRLLRAIEGIQFEYPESSGGDTINNVNIDLNLDLTNYGDIQLNYEQQLDQAFNSVDLDDYKLSYSVAHDVSFVSELIQEMFLRSLNVAEDPATEEPIHNLSIGILIIIALILVVISAFFRRTR